MSSFNYVIRILFVFYYIIRDMSRTCGLIAKLSIGNYNNFYLDMSGVIKYNEVYFAR